MAADGVHTVGQILQARPAHHLVADPNFGRPEAVEGWQLPVDYFNLYRERLADQIEIILHMTWYLLQ